jgi:NAD+ synthase
VTFSRDILSMNLEQTTTTLTQRLRDTVLSSLKRRGVIVAVSGGVDSACVAALATRALGPERVHALLLPERESSDESLALGEELCRGLSIPWTTVDITPVLSALQCYEARDAAVRSVFPAFRPEMPWKIVLHGDRLNSDALNVFHIVVEADDGEHRFRLPPRAYLEIVAATNFKQRVRTMMSYYHADRLVFAVAGTPNRLEYDQGFFVKLGDGAADVKPIASLYKSQVCALAAHLGVPASIVQREPTTDTYSLAQSQEDFYFQVPYRTLDLLLWAKNNNVPIEECARVLGLSTSQVERVWQDIAQKRRSTAYLHAPPVLLEDIPELAPYAVAAETTQR